MATSAQSDRPRATRWEILGARLRIWTLPRGVEPPGPPSRRALAVGCTVLAGGVVLLIGVVAPAIDGSKDRSAAADRRAHDAAVRAERGRLSAEQAAHLGRVREAANLHAAGNDVAARAALLAAVRADVARDARARVAAGSLAGPIRHVRCEPTGLGAGPRVHILCLAVTASVVDGRPRSAQLGHPFAAAGSLRDGRYAWCKQNDPAGEGSSLTGVFVALPARCTR